MRHLLLFISALIMSGCAKHWYVGEWAVSDAKFPGISAMALDEAKEWYGSKAVYSSSLVRFRNEMCSDPVFSVELLTENDFKERYRASFSELSIEGDLAEVVQVGCPLTWTAPGSTFIKSNRDTAYILWDGVFFKLKRSF